MNYLKIKLKDSKTRKLLIYLSLLSFIISFLLFKKLDTTLLLNNLKNIQKLLNTTHLNFFLPHLIIILILSFFALFNLNFLSFPIYYCFEAICIFYNILSFTAIYYFKGFIYSLFYIFLTKFFYLSLIFLLIHQISSLTKIIFTNILNKTHLSLKKNLKITIFLLLALFIYDLFLYFFGTNILSFFLPFN